MRDRAAKIMKKEDKNMTRMTEERKKEKVEEKKEGKNRGKGKEKKMK